MKQIGFNIIVLSSGNKRGESYPCERVSIIMRIHKSEFDKRVGFNVKFHHRTEYCNYLDYGIDY